MRKITNSERNLFRALGKYPVAVRKNFTLFHAGARGNDYFDIDRITSDLDAQKSLVEELEKLIHGFENKGMKYNKLGFLDKESGPTGLIVLASILSQRLNKEFVVIRLWEKLKFDYLKVKGLARNEGDDPIDSNDSILIVDDVITTGGTQKKAIEIIREFGANVAGIACAFIRSKDAISELDNLDVHYVDSIWTYNELLYLGYISPDPELLVSRDFTHELVKELNKRFELDVPLSEDEIDKELDIKINELLNNKIISSEIMQGLKNAYLSSLVNLAIIS